MSFLVAHLHNENVAKSTNASSEWITVVATPLSHFASCSQAQRSNEVSDFCRRW
ncbi:hypothetical protein R69658_04252 [Paraburkholderia aspalathi]|uniref:Uncharacterized protein n=1 Tax=Paraburkholderia aspalathi TaxID=1324617 RepID=A0A1I7A1Z5_9BURK|nr:hypothetical protein [Paraburkholderia sediminicola]CAE6744403.1 hypothetical protein R20943_02597 [Paraburkholderia aspalathi]CAE6760105.1 hypothetical protein R69746_03353 [Paraburkholderia aspalathi]CAE6785079.1 hypothetical protein R69658_04252 [Paraburkholderia aspalathi]SFT68958.1 hypothetical protein SAMN05192563_100332 [Paraburkholderia aspalathi]